MFVSFSFFSPSSHAVEQVECFSMCLRLLSLSRAFTRHASVNNCGQPCFFGKSHLFGPLLSTYSDLQCCLWFQMIGLMLAERCFPYAESRIKLCQLLKNKQKNERTLDTKRNDELISSCPRYLWISIVRRKIKNQ